MSGLPESLAVEQQHLEVLRELLNVSQLKIESGQGNQTSEAWVSTIEKASGQKCERCWHWETDVGSDPAHPTICARCVEAVKTVSKP